VTVDWQDNYYFSIDVAQSVTVCRVRQSPDPGAKGSKDS